MSDLPTILTLFIEFICSLILIYVILVTGDALSIAFTLMGLIFFAAKLSGAHINPTVSLVAYFNGKLSGYNTAAYIGVQILGGLCALFIYNEYVKNQMLPMQCMMPKSFA